MKGFIQKAVASLCLGGGAVLGGIGCQTYNDLVDPCYPERYNYQARQEVREAFAPQVRNGRILDQTIWNYYFDAGTDKLTAGGREQLAYIARRRPIPDPKVYLQTAQDLIYDPAAPEKMVQARNDLDNRRTAAIQKFLTAQTAGRPCSFDVVVHDPAEVGIEAKAIGGSTAPQLPQMGSMQKRDVSFQGVAPMPLTTSSGGGAGGGGASRP